MLIRTESRLIMNPSSTSPAHKECTVLFADLAGSTQLYQQVGDTSAFKLVDQLVSTLRRLVELHNGAVIKHTGVGVMAVFQNPDDAARVSMAIHEKLRDSHIDVEHPLLPRIGFQHGAVIQSESDVFGDTVNCAARLCELSSTGRALTTAETAAQLSVDWRNMLQAVPPRVLRGGSNVAELFELRSDSFGDVTILHSSVSTGREEVGELRLEYQGQLYSVNADRPIIRIGRDRHADIYVSDQRTSRRHATVELRVDKFVLTDRSSNGTWVLMDNEKEFMASREEVLLYGNGVFALGGSTENNPCRIAFFNL